MKHQTDSRNTWTRRLSALIASALVLTFVLPASADELAAILGDLSWGSSRAAVEKHIKKKIDKKTAETIKGQRDSIQKDKIRRAARNKFKEVKASWTDLRGSRTTYDVSVVGGEFEKNNGEALLLHKEGIAHQYYFFLDKKLTKLVVVYSSEYLAGIGFEAFVDQVTGKYGEPAETEYDIKDDLMLRAIWRDNATELRIDDKSGFYGTYTMAFADKASAERLAKMRSAFADNSESETSIGADIREIQEDDGFGSDSNVVDSIVGGSVEVNLDRGRSEEAALIRVGSSPGAADISAERAKKRKKARKRKGRRKPGKKAKTDDLIIY